jgi:hypothetical protein
MVFVLFYGLLFSLTLIFISFIFFHLTIGILFEDIFWALTYSTNDFGNESRLKTSHRSTSRVNSPSHESFSKQDLKDEWMLDVGASSTLEMCELASS